MAVFMQNIKNYVTMESVKSWVLIFIIVFILCRAGRRTKGLINRICLFVFIIQVLYFLGTTGFNDIVPVASIFKYDILSKAASVFSGTPISDVLLYINSVIQFICINLWDILHSLILGS